MPAAASATTRPSLTSAKANTSTADSAKNSVVAIVSRLRTSTVTSFRKTSHAVRANTVSESPCATGTQSGRPRAPRSCPRQASVPQRYGSRDRDPSGAERRVSPGSPAAPDGRDSPRRAARRPVDVRSSPVKGSSSNTSRGSCRSARSSARRWRMPREKLLTKSSARSTRSAAARARSTAPSASRDAAQFREEHQVLASGQLGIELQIVTQPADRLSQRSLRRTRPCASRSEHVLTSA